MTSSRRLREGRQSRDLWTRQGSQDTFRRNSPDGWLHDFLPIPWDGGGDGTAPGDWWVGSDNPRQYGPNGLTYGPIGPAGPAVGPRQRTTGSPLTEYDQRGVPAGPGHLLPAVTRCTTVLVEAVVRTLWSYRTADGQHLPRPLWIDDPMLLGRAPGPIFPLQPQGKRLGGHQFFSTLLTDAIWWGQGGFVFIEGSNGEPLPGSCIPLNPLTFTSDDSGHVVLDRWGESPLTVDWDGRFEMGGDTWRVAVLRGLYPNHDGWPQGVLLRHWDTFKIGAAIQGYVGDFFGRTGIPSGYLSVSTPNFGVEVDDPDRPGERIYEQDLLKRNWMRAHGSGRRSVAVLNSTVSYTPISVNPVDAEVVKISDAMLRDVAHAFGMSSIWLDLGVGGMSYSNSSERRADLVSMTAAGWGEKMTDLISSLMPYGTRVSINWPSFISPSVETLSPSMVQLVQAGILTASEARQYLGITQWTGEDVDFIDTSKASGYQPPVGITATFVGDQQEETP